MQLNYEQGRESITRVEQIRQGAQIHALLVSMYQTKNPRESIRVFYFDDGEQYELIISASRIYWPEFEYCYSYSICGTVLHLMRVSERAIKTRYAKTFYDKAQKKNVTITRNLSGHIVDKMKIQLTDLVLTNNVHEWKSCL